MVIGEALSIEQKFDFIVENYVEFEEALIKAGIQRMVLGGRDFTWFSVNRGLFDRRIMNLLTTAISYSDSVKQHLDKIFLSNIDEVKLAMDGYSKQYDSRLGYRTMCKLRNFVQHEGLPVHGTSYSSNWIEKDDLKKAVMRNTVDPYLTPSELREGKFNRTILEELEAMGERIDLKSLVRDYVEGLSIAHVALRHAIDQRVTSAVLTIEKTIESFKREFPDEKSSGGLVAVKGATGVPFEEQLAVLQEPNEYRLHLEKKNPKLVNLSRQYISTEVVDD
jgi:hypothetical protein